MWGWKKNKEYPEDSDKGPYSKHQPKKKMKNVFIELVNQQANYSSFHHIYKIDTGEQSTFKTESHNNLKKYHLKTK